MTEIHRAVRDAARALTPESAIGRGLVVIAYLCMSTWLAFTSPEMRRVAAPAMVMVVLGVFFARQLYVRDKRLPIFESGTLAVLATVLYGVMPIVNYIAGGLKWIPYSDARLLSFGQRSEHLPMFGWRFVVYLTAFVAAYLIVRGRVAPTVRPVAPVKRNYAIAMLMILVSTELFVIVVEWSYGVHLRPSHAQALKEKTIWDLPLFARQITHVIMGAAVVIKYWLVGLLLMHWPRRFWRVVLFGWLALEVASTVLRFGARGELVLLVLATVLLYHRLIAALKLRVLVPTGVAFLGAFFLYGVIRDMRGEVRDVATSEYPLLAYSNEFQAVLGTAYDLHVRQEAGILPPVPWQIFVADAYMVIPSQFLPFEKIDPAGWYLDAVGIKGAGFMFGVMSQAVLGFGSVELLVRGLILGMLLGRLHRWYVLHQERFWPTMMYLFVCIWIFYSVRNSTFSPVYLLLYRFAFAMVAVRVVTSLLDKAQRIRSAKAPLA
jgi:hypothetical protein